MRYSNFKDMIIEKVSDAAFLPAELFVAITQAGYGASYKKLEWELEKAQSWKQSSPVRQQTRRNFQSLLYKLKKDGLIKQNGNGWIATKLGRARLTKLNNKPSHRYQTKSDGTTTIIIFDVPEKQSYKRIWLRTALRTMKFKMLQKSVWSANILLPKEFLNDLKFMNLIDHVEIFTVVKYGSLAQ